MVGYWKHSTVIFKTWLLQLRTGCTSWTTSFPAPCAKQKWLLRVFLARKPWRQKQIQFVDNMSKMIKWCNDNKFFLTTYFHNPCSVVYFWLISSSYIKRNITSFNNVTWTTTFNAHLNAFLRFFSQGKKMKWKFVCLY